MLSQLSEPDRASSPIFGIILLIGITVILAILVLLLCSQFQMPGGDPTVPDIFKIKSITFVADKDGTNMRGFVTLSNTQTVNYRNRYLGVVTYINGEKSPCHIPTLNNELFCKSSHIGVWHLQGVGTWGGMNKPTSVWPGHSDISIEYKKGMLHPGDTVTLEVIDTRTNQIISRDTWPEPEKYDTQWFYNYFLNQEAT